MELKKKKLIEYKEQQPSVMDDLLINFASWRNRGKGAEMLSAKIARRHPDEDPEVVDTLVRDWVGESAVNEAVPGFIASIPGRYKRNLAIYTGMSDKSRFQVVDKDMVTKKPFRDMWLVYVRKGKAFAYGLGGNITTLNRETYNRKNAIEYADEIYAIHPDDEVHSKRRDRMGNKFDQEWDIRNKNADRSKKLVARYSDRIKARFAELKSKLKDAYAEVIDSLDDKFDSGNIYSASDLQKLVSAKVSKIEHQMGRLGHIMWTLKTWRDEDPVRMSREITKALAEGVLIAEGIDTSELSPDAKSKLDDMLDDDFSLYDMADWEHLAAKVGVDTEDLIEYVMMNTRNNSAFAEDEDDDDLGPAGGFEAYYIGNDEVKLDGRHVTVRVYDFEDDEDALDEFLNDVGGAPHPLGGNRAVLTVEEDSPSQTKIDFND